MTFLEDGGARGANFGLWIMDFGWKRGKPGASVFRMPVFREEEEDFQKGEPSSLICENPRNLWMTFLDDEV
jgi:hypothetical protein